MLSFILMTSDASRSSSGESTRPSASLSAMRLSISTMTLRPKPGTRMPSVAKDLSSFAIWVVCICPLPHSDLICGLLFKSGFKRSVSVAMLGCCDYAGLRLGFGRRRVQLFGQRGIYGRGYEIVHAPAELHHLFDAAGIDELEL